MHFRLGYDMGIVLIKAIIMSMLSVFLLMPGLLVLFSKAIDKTHHRSFVPKISLWGKLTVKTRYVIPRSSSSSRRRPSSSRTAAPTSSATARSTP